MTVELADRPGVGTLPGAVAYVDGGCDPNPGRGAYAAVVIGADGTTERVGVEETSTNQRAEILAAVLAVEILEAPTALEVVSDSQYLVKCATGEWKTKANMDLWERLEASALVGDHRLTYRWVRGHAGNPGNERAHDLVEGVLWAR